MESHSLKSSKKAYTVISAKLRITCPTCPSSQWDQCLYTRRLRCNPTTKCIILHKSALFCICFCITTTSLFFILGAQSEIANEPPKRCGTRKLHHCLPPTYSYTKSIMQNYVVLSLLLCRIMQNYAELCICIKLFKCTTQT